MIHDGGALLSATTTGPVGGMVGLLSLTSTTWTLMVVVPLSGGLPLSVACTTSLQWGSTTRSRLMPRAPANACAQSGSQ